MKTTAWLALAATVCLMAAAPVRAQEKRKDQLETKALAAADLMAKKDYVGCANAYEELTKLDPENAAPYYRLGSCFLNQAREANELAFNARENRNRFVQECNRTQSCGEDANKARLQELEKADRLCIEDFERKRSRALDAFAMAVVIGGSGFEVTAARMELEQLYRTIASPQLSLEDFIAQKKKQNP